MAKTKLLCVYYSRLTPRMQMRIIFLSGAQRRDCLLYTSDAADEGLGVDLGGRRIIKKNFFQAEDGIRDAQESRGLGDVYKRQVFAFGKNEIALRVL